jgi:isorenieratene synthase
MRRRQFMQATGLLAGGVVGAGALGCTPAGPPGLPVPADPLDLLFPPDARRRIVQVAPRNPTSPPLLSPPGSRSVLVVGGGIAGLSAATELAERGYRVQVREADEVLGGRLATRDLDPGTGETFRVEHGLHMWFDNYRTFADLRHRLGIDDHFRPYTQVDFVFRTHRPERLESTPKLFPANLAGIVDRSPNLDWGDILGSSGILPDLFQFDFRRVFERLDGITFDEWMRRTRVTPRFAEVILQPAAHVTLNRVEELSAAEMVLYQHLYFTSQPFAFDREVTTVDHGTAVIDPWVAHLRRLGVQVRTSAPVPGLRIEGGRAVGVVGEPERHDAVVLAADVPGARAVLAGSRADAASAEGLARISRRVGALKVAPPYKILRLWLDRRPDAARPEVIETPQHSPLSLICSYHLLEQESAEWARRTGGSVLELHLYALDEPYVSVDDDGLWGLVRPLVLEVMPELARAQVLGRTVGSYENFTSFAVGQAAGRPFPGTAVADGVGGLFLAGDWVSAPAPSALMERSVLTGRLAANEVLVADGVREVGYSHVSGKGPLR